MNFEKHCLQRYRSRCKLVTGRNATGDHAKLCHDPSAALGRSIVLMMASAAHDRTHRKEGLRLRQPDRIRGSAASELRIFSA